MVRFGFLMAWSIIVDIGGLDSDIFLTITSYAAKLDDIASYRIAI